MHSAFTYAAVGMVLVSTAGRVLQANDALAVLLGRRAADFTGIELWQLAHPDDADALRAAIHGMLDGAVSACPTELRFRHVTGTDVTVALNASYFSEGLAIVVDGRRRS